MNFIHVWKSAKAAADEISRSIRERQLPPMLAVMSFLARESIVPHSVLMALSPWTENPKATRSAPSEVAITTALQALSQWMIAVRNNELPANSVTTQYARQFASWLASQAQDEDARRRAAELANQLSLPAFQWLSRTLIDNHLTTSESQDRVVETASARGRGAIHE